MMSAGGHDGPAHGPRATVVPPAPPTASTAGEIAVEEYGYALGPPTGALVLRYPPCGIVADFPDERNDFVHQLFWSPDGVLAVHRGSTSRFVPRTEMLWVRKGAHAAVRALGVQTVLRLCVRQAPPVLSQLSAAALAPPSATGSALLSLAAPGVDDDTALRTRDEVLAALAREAPDEVTFAPTRTGPAHEAARAIVKDPADGTGLADWAARLHVSPKTLQRDFEREYAMTFTAWRTRTRLRAAAALLPDLSVTETAHRVGYGSASAFVAAFTREFGTTPGRYPG